MILSDYAPHPVLAIFCGFAFVGGLVLALSAPGTRDRHHAWLTTLKSEAVTVAHDKVDPKNEGRWIYLVGDVSGCEEVFVDTVYGVSRRCFSLKRHGQVYRTDLGEDSPPENWAKAGPTDSSVLRDQSWRVQNPKLGEYVISAELLHEYWKHISGIEGAEPNTESKAKPPDWDKLLSRQLDERWPKMALSDATPTGWKPMADGRHWFLGADPARPKHLDRRISFRCAQFADRQITVLAKQQSGVLRGDDQSSGNRHFTCIRPGALTLDELFDEASRDNSAQYEQQRTGGARIALIALGIFAAGCTIAASLRRSARLSPLPNPHSELPS